MNEGLVWLILIVGGILWLFQFGLGIAINLLAIISAFVDIHSIWFYGIGGFLILYAFIHKANLYKKEVEKKQVDRKFKSIRDKLEQLQQQVISQWQDWEN